MLSLKLRGPDCDLLHIESTVEDIPFLERVRCAAGQGRLVLGSLGRPWRRRVQSGETDGLLLKTESWTLVSPMDHMLVLRSIGLINRSFEFTEIRNLYRRILVVFGLE